LLKSPHPEPAHAAAVVAEERELRKLLGRELHVYRCRSLLGRGGMGWVYLAEHRDLGRPCALKILSPRLAAQDPDYLQNFWNEGRASASLTHPNIVTTHAIGEAEGLHYLEMEFVRGRSLQQQLEAGRLSPIKATAIIVQIAEGLAAAHQAGILHRDLKPDNVLMTHRGVPKIADFGLAKRLLPTAETVPQPYLAGTPQYMAPELFQGEPASTMSDVYALGVCYFLLLTGRLPFARSRLNDLIAAAVHQPFPSLREARPEASLEIVECVGLLTSRTPANRPRSGLEAAQLLNAVFGQLRDLEDLVHEAFDGITGITWSREGSLFRIRVTLPHGRAQIVNLESEEQLPLRGLVHIFTTCGSAQPSYYEQALRLNARVAHGGIAIRDLEGQSCFVMVDTYPRGTVDAEEIRKSVLGMAREADGIECHLTGKDTH
jgi:serine/threonine-protein kinase